MTFCCGKNDSVLGNVVALELFMQINFVDRSLNIMFKGSQYPEHWRPVRTVLRCTILVSVA